jgi:hypothetical protein
MHPLRNNIRGRGSQDRTLESEGLNIELRAGTARIQLPALHGRRFDPVINESFGVIRATWNNKLIKRISHHELKRGIDLLHSEERSFSSVMPYWVKEPIPMVYSLKTIEEDGKAYYYIYLFPVPEVEGIIKLRWAPDYAPSPK